MPQEGETFTSPNTGRTAVFKSGQWFEVGGPQGVVAGQPPRNPRGALPASYIEKEMAAKDEIQGAYTIAKDLTRYEGAVGSGALKLNPLKNLEYKVKNAVGASDPNSREYASFRASLEKLRNDSLRLNKGVQTEGDAVRAWNELLSNMNDGGVVSQRMAEIRKINERAARLKLMTLNEARRQANLPPLKIEDIVGGEGAIAAPKAPAGKVVIDIYGRPAK